MTRRHLAHIISLILPTALVALVLCGCEALTAFQQKPLVQFAEAEAVKLTAAFFSSGGKIDTGWGVANGLNLIGDIANFQQDNATAAAKVKQAASDFSGNPQAVNGLANGLADVVVKLAPATASQRSAIVLALASGIQHETAAIATADAQP